MSLIRVLYALTAIAVVGACAGPPKPAAPPQQQEADWPGAIVNAGEAHEPEGSSAVSALSIRQVTYVSKSGINDAYTHLTTSIYVPLGSPPQGGFPVIAYGREIGTATPECAFSAPAAQQKATDVINAFLKAGYVVTVPDYQGLGNPSDGRLGYHPYLDSATGGYSLIDAVRVTRKLTPQTSEVWFAVGDAQGGQAAWAANELSDDYGHPTLHGTVSVSPTADLGGLADAAAAGTLTPDQQKMYIEQLAALAKEYGSQVNLDDYRRGTVKQNWDLLRSCNPADDNARTAAFAQIQPDDLRPTSPALSLLQGYLQKTTLPQGPAQQPMLVLFGEDSALAPAQWTQRALSRACEFGDTIAIREQPSATLTDPAVLAWMSDRAANKPPVNDCPSFLAAHPAPPPAEPKPAPPLPPPTPPTAAPTADGHRTSDAGQISLINGWLPITIQVAAVSALIAATGWRTRRWRLRWLPAAVAVGIAAIVAVKWILDSQGWGPSYPWGLWPWIGLTGLAAAVLIFGWRGSPWWRRAIALASVPLCLVATATAVNASLTYLPTVQAAWQRATGHQPPQWIDQDKLRAMQQADAKPTSGTVVSIKTPSDISGFAHRDELVYLPPVWFSSNPPPRLPVVMVIGPEFSSPPDWLLYARGLDIIDRFAHAHGGAAPVVVFPDTSGSFTNDTECVNGPRGNAADHITKEFVPYVISNFGVSADASGWGVAGWSTGGTCSVMMLATHPELFSAIVSLDGQLGPNAGPKNQTIARLFGGDAEAWAAFDPRTAVQRHGLYQGKAAWLGVAGDVPTVHSPAGTGAPPHGPSDADWDTKSEDHTKNATLLCGLFAAYGIECSVVGYSGAHDYVSAAAGFADALPWLAGRLGTPGVPQVALPGA